MARSGSKRSLLIFIRVQGGVHAQTHLYVQPSPVRGACFSRQRKVELEQRRGQQLLQRCPLSCVRRTGSSCCSHVSDYGTCERDAQTPECVLSRNWGPTSRPLLRVQRWDGTRPQQPPRRHRGTRYRRQRKSRRKIVLEIQEALQRRP